MRIRIANPANLNAFFEELRNKWLESGGNIFKDSQTSYQQPSIPQIYQPIVPQIQQPIVSQIQQPSAPQIQRPQPRYIISGW